MSNIELTEKEIIDYLLKLVNARGVEILVKTHTTATLRQVDEDEFAVLNTAKAWLKDLE